MIPLVDLRKQFLDIEGEINEGFKKLFESCQFVLGEEVDRFEKEFADYLGVKYVVGVGSGTEALHLAAREAGVGRGDEVILPANTFIATALAVSYTGARPVFVDIDEKSYNIDVQKIEEKITKKTKVIIPVHLYGQPADMAEILTIAEKHGIQVIEDASQAHGARYKGERVGTLGRSGCFSFYPGKNLGAYGDGGAIVTNNDETARRITLLRNYGQEEKYKHELIGFNSRLDSMQAVVLRVKLRWLDSWNDKRKFAANLYSVCLSETVLTPPVLADRDHVFHVYAIRVNKRNRLLDYLNTSGIGAGIHYPIPIHLQPCYSYLGYKKGDFPVTEKVSDEQISLPIYPEISEESVREVAARIIKFLEID